MKEYEAQYYPKEKAFLLVYKPHKETIKKDGKTINKYNYKIIYDSRSETLKKETEKGEFFIDDFISNKVEFNWKNKNTVKRALFHLIFRKTESFIKADPANP